MNADASTWLFRLFSLVFIVGGAVMTVTRRNAVSAVMSLVATFFGLAVVYALLLAHFLAVLQVLVYAGAIMTLFVFVVMVLNREEVDRWAHHGLGTRALGGLLGAGVVGYLAYFLSAWQYQSPGPPPPGEWGGVASVGEVLFRDYLFPFEAVSLLLLVAVIAAIVVARAPHRSEPEPEPRETGGEAAGGH